MKQLLPSSLGLGDHLDAVEQRIELGFVDLDPSRAGTLRLWNAEHFAVEPFVEETQPGAIEEQNFRSVASTSEEHEECTAARLVADAVLDNSRQPIELEAMPETTTGVGVDPEIPSANPACCNFSPRNVANAPARVALSSAGWREKSSRAPIASRISCATAPL